MKTKLTLALALAGLIATANSPAEEVVVTATSESAAVNTEELNRTRAREATEAAVEQAVKTVLTETRLDLDIRLIGPTSVKIAGDR